MIASELPDDLGTRIREAASTIAARVAVSFTSTRGLRLSTTVIEDFELVCLMLPRAGDLTGPRQANPEAGATEGLPRPWSGKLVQTPCFELLP